MGAAAELDPERCILSRLARVLTLALVSMAAAPLPPTTMKTMTTHPAQSAAAPSPRSDANSMLAHKQLVAKARGGGIDLYFLGDSITRRWGCTDPQWSDMLTNWKQNFFGWNAANFGWGGDRIQNMLWRIQNGGFGGVDTKRMVIFAGANNRGKQPGGGGKER